MSDDIKLSATVTMSRETFNKVTAASTTLTHLGYTYRGGEQWAPPIGPAPNFIKGEDPSTKTLVKVNQAMDDIQDMVTLRSDAKRLILYRLNSSLLRAKNGKLSDENIKEELIQLGQWWEAIA